MSPMARSKASKRRFLGSVRGQRDRPSARRQLLARASSSVNLAPVSSTDRCASRPLRGGAILIANLELEFHVSPIRITKLRFSNRKYSPLFRSTWRIAISRSAVSSVVVDRPFALRRHRAKRPLVTKFLIGTQGLEFRRNSNKTNLITISNRYKMRFSRCVSARRVLWMVRRRLRDFRGCVRSGLRW